jgi:TonB family protein
MLVTEMLDRSAQSTEARDITAAQTWIDAAAPLAPDPARVELAQERITAFVFAAEAQKLLPASDFVQTNYVAPEYPRVALDRGVEGWVDLEFVITESGETESIRVIEASNDRYFRDEAVAAVEQWRFTPDTFMDRPIARRSFARLAFVLD